MSSRAEKAESAFRVGEHLVQPSLNRISCRGKTVKLEPRVMEILVCLAERSGETVRRDDLLRMVWDEAHVTEDALNRAIWKLRQAFKKNGEDGQVIETVPKKGYRLAMPCRIADGSPAVAASTAVAEPSSAVEEWPATVAASSPSARRGGTGWAVAGLLMALVGLAALLPRGSARPPSVPSEAASRWHRYTPFTTLTGYESSPAVSPDGTRAVFVHYAKDGPRKLQLDLLLEPIDGGTPKLLTDSLADDQSPAWSADGERIAFARIDEGSCEILLMHVDERREERLTTCGPAAQPPDYWTPDLAWLPGGEQLVFTDRPDPGGPARIYRYTLAEGRRSVLTDPPLQDLGDSQVAVSRDGGRLAFARTRATDLEDLYVLALGDGNDWRLSYDNQPIRGIVWSADDSHLLYASKRAGTYRLWQLALTGGPALPLSTVGINATWPSLSEAGDLLLYEEWKSEINIWRVPLSDAATEPGPLVTSSRWDWRPQLSPDGSEIAFLSNRSGATEVWVAARAGDEARPLTSFDMHFATTPRWSPDGRSLALAAPPRGHFDLYLLDPETSALVRHTDDASDDRYPTWSRDGRYLYYGSNRGGSWQLWKIAVEGGSPRQVTVGGGLVGFESGDGTALYFIKRVEPGIWRKDLASGVETRVLADATPMHAAAWDVVGDAAYFLRSVANSPPAVERLDLVSGQVETLMVLALRAREHHAEVFPDAGLSVAADGSELLVSSVDRSDSDLWMARAVAPVEP